MNASFSHVEVAVQLRRVFGDFSCFGRLSGLESIKIALFSYLAPRPGFIWSRFWPGEEASVLSTSFYWLLQPAACKLHGSGCVTVALRCCCAGTWVRKVYSTRICIVFCDSPCKFHWRGCTPVALCFFCKSHGNGCAKVATIRF